MYKYTKKSNLILTKIAAHPSEHAAIHYSFFTLRLLHHFVVCVLYLLAVG